MSSPVLTRRRWLLKAHGQHIVIVKGTHERFTHPLMKAFLWALYLPHYPQMTVEVRIADRYKPDVIAFNPTPQFSDKPVFWGEAGQVGYTKIEALVKRYPDTHFVIGKWDTPLRTFMPHVQEALASVKRHAPFDVIDFPDSCADFIDTHGNICITHADVRWERL